MPGAMVNGGRTRLPYAWCHGEWWQNEASICPVPGWPVTRRGFLQPDIRVAGDKKRLPSA